MDKHVSKQQGSYLQALTDYCLPEVRLTPETKSDTGIKWSICEVVPRSISRGVERRDQEGKKAEEGALTSPLSLWTIEAQPHWGLWK